MSKALAREEPWEGEEGVQDLQIRRQDIIPLTRLRWISVFHAEIPPELRVAKAPRRLFRLCAIARVWKCRRIHTEPSRAQDAGPQHPRYADGNDGRGDGNREQQADTWGSPHVVSPVTARIRRVRPIRRFRRRPRRAQTLVVALRLVCSCLGRRPKASKSGLGCSQVAGWCSLRS